MHAVVAYKNSLCMTWDRQSLIKEQERKNGCNYTFLQLTLGRKDTPAPQVLAGKQKDASEMQSNMSQRKEK